jgi:hypothetical protein
MSLFFSSINGAGEFPNAIPPNVSVFECNGHVAPDYKLLLENPFPAIVSIHWLVNVLPIDWPATSAKKQGQRAKTWRVK